MKGIVDMSNGCFSNAGMVVAGHALAPFTRTQIASLNSYQGSSMSHPFTCGTDSGHLPLHAEADGWVCLDCDYTQTWAHAHMADWSWREATQAINDWLDTHD